MSATPLQDDHTEKTIAKSEASKSSCDFCYPDTSMIGPQILTTTNAYIFPKRVYHVYCQPSAAWSGPSYSDMCQSQGSEQRLVFPKLIIPGRQSNPERNITRSKTVGRNQMILHQMPLVKRNSEWAKTSLPTPLPRLFESRCRSSTQDSFDSKFNVDTAVKHQNSALAEYSRSEQMPSHLRNDDRGLLLPVSLEQESTPDGFNLSTEASTSLSETSTDAGDEAPTNHKRIPWEEFSPDTSQESRINHDVLPQASNADNDSACSVKDEAVGSGQEVWAWDDEDEWETSVSSLMSSGSEEQVDHFEDDWEWSH